MFVTLGPGLYHSFLWSRVMYCLYTGSSICSTRLQLYKRLIRVTLIEGENKKLRFLLIALLGSCFLFITLFCSCFLSVYTIIWSYDIIVNGIYYTCLGICTSVIYDTIRGFMINST